MICVDNELRHKINKDSRDNQLKGNRRGVGHKHLPEPTTHGATGVMVSPAVLML